MGFKPRLSRRDFVTATGLATFTLGASACGPSRSSPTRSSGVEGYAVKISSGEIVDSDTYKSLTDALDNFTLNSGAVKVAVAVYNYSTEELYSYNPHYSGYEASIVKIPIALSAMRLAYAQGQNLSQDYADFLEASIAWSDNDSTTMIYKSLGSTDEKRMSVVNDTYTKLDVTDTQHRGTWGVNPTNPRDQVAVIRSVFEGLDWVSAHDMSLLRSAMNVGNYTQEWGVGFYNGNSQAEKVLCKNGWITDDDGLWYINSVGLIRAEGKTYALAVMNSGFTAQQDGEKLASDMVSTVMDHMV